MARPAAPTLKLKGSVGKVTVSWTKVKGASGYQIASASSANGKFRKLATVSSKKSRRYVHKKRKGGKTYYYKVRSYTKVGKRKVYSKFSPVKKATPPTKLQSQTNRFIKKATKPSMTKEQKLRACYVYMRDHYTYKTREVVEIGATGWVSRYASKFFSDKGGNCCSWAAAYTTVAKRLGFQAKAISGKIYYTNGKLWGRHGWTEIPMEGKIRVFDPEIEYSYRRRGKKINLYKVSRTDNGVAIYKRK